MGSSLLDFKRVLLLKDYIYVKGNDLYSVLNLTTVKMFVCQVHDYRTWLCIWFPSRLIINFMHFESVSITWVETFCWTHIPHSGTTCSYVCWESPPSLRGRPLLNTTCFSTKRNDFRMSGTWLYTSIWFMFMEHNLHSVLQIMTEHLLSLVFNKIMSVVYCFTNVYRARLNLHDPTRPVLASVLN